MNWNLFALFVVMNIINVILQTIKSIVTIKGNKWTASIVNALAYGLYTWIVVLMVSDLPLLVKCFVVGFANLVGVFVVKVFEEKSYKQKLWKCEIAIPCDRAQRVMRELTNSSISHNYTTVGKYVMFNCYCKEKAETKKAAEIAKNYNGKISAYESKMI